LIIDIEGEYGFVVSGPSGKNRKLPYSVTLPDEAGMITWRKDKEDAIKEMETFVREAQKALEVLYGFPGGGGAAPALTLVEAA